MLFSDFSLKQGLLKALAEMNYINATPIQSKVIQLTLAGNNIVGQSQTGTGKTAAFLIPLLQKIDTNVVGLQALILAPTRELVNQIGEEIFALTKYYRVNAVCVYGGASQVVQKKYLSKRPSIIVATPGRLLDFINQKVVDISKVSYLILDEVDRMLDMGFVRDIQKIRGQMNQLKQTLTFSATISPEIKTIIQGHITDYEFIKIGEAVTVDKINHAFVPVAHTDKIINLLALIHQHSKDKILVFTQTKRNTQTLLFAIEKAGYKACMLNGNMSQGKRNATLKDFKDARLKILVTTDVAARGLNMDNVGLVINFDVPKEPESYIHRIGRTGRAGASGKAIMLVSGEEKQLFAQIEKMHRIRIQQSDHIPLIDTKSQFASYHLDKSTDKFGKGRPNPNAGRRAVPAHAAHSSPRPSAGRPAARPAARPFKERDVAPGRTGPARSKSKTLTRSSGSSAKIFRSSREDAPSSSAQPARGAAHRRPFRGAGKGFNDTRKTYPARSGFKK